MSERIECVAQMAATLYAAQMQKGGPGSITGMPANQLAYDQVATHAWALYYAVVNQVEAASQANLKWKQSR